MTTELIGRLIFAAGFAQLGVLIAAALVPIRLNWRDDLQSLSRLHRQMHWTYGGYVVLSIVAFALLSIFNAGELAGGGRLAQGLCLYIAVFWGVRLGLQGVFDVSEHLTASWLRAGYALLTLLFAVLTGIYALAALRLAH